MAYPSQESIEAINASCSFHYCVQWWISLCHLGSIRIGGNIVGELTNAEVSAAKKMLAERNDSNNEDDSDDDNDDYNDDDNNDDDDDDDDDSGED